MKRLRSGLRALVLCATLLLCVITASAADSGLSGLPKLSKGEIIDLLQKPELTDPDNYYEQTPSITAPHAAGVMRQEILDSGLQRLNVVRRLAGLGPVTMNEVFNDLSQKGSVVLAAGKQFTHYPQKPADMDQAFFDDGESATMHSNLAYYGYGSTASGPYFLPDPLSWSIDGYMSDSDRYNVEVVGHRRWMIDPRLTQVGMGAAHAYYQDGRWFCTDLYSATYWDVDWNIRADYDFIAWPASGLFPTTNFIVNTSASQPQSDAWSVSLNPNRYRTPNRDEVTVTLTGGGQSWSFDAAQSYAIDDTGAFFTVDTQGCGEGAAIIFRPDVTKAYDGLYTVTIAGLKTKAGADTTLEYSVEFFTPTCLDGHSYTTLTTAPSCTAPGLEQKVCSLCGHESSTPLPELGHLWSDAVCGDEESHTVTCTRSDCGEEQKLPHDRRTAVSGDVTVITCSGCDLHTALLAVNALPGSGLSAACFLQERTVHLTLTNTASRTLTATLWLAEYDDTGRMVVCTPQTLTVPVGGSASETLSPVSSDTHTVALHVLGGNLVPLTTRARFFP